MSPCAVVKTPCGLLPVILFSFSVWKRYYSHILLASARLYTIFKGCFLSSTIFADVCCLLSVQMNSGEHPTTHESQRL